MKRYENGKISIPHKQMVELMMCYVHLSYLWGGKIWGSSK
tara:strand:+ start:619 stop:738 length:120 start_codon:yes stop_codon:yes gene_type:complete